MHVTGDEKIGVQIVRRALEAPLRQIAENAGLEGKRDRGQGQGREGRDRGFDAETLEAVEMMQVGIIDLRRWKRAALENRPRWFAHLRPAACW